MRAGWLALLLCALLGCEDEVQPSALPPPPARPPTEDERADAISRERFLLLGRLVDEASTELFRHAIRHVERVALAEVSPLSESGVEPFGHVVDVPTPSGDRLVRTLQPQLEQYRATIYLYRRGERFDRLLLLASRDPRDALVAVRTHAAGTQVADAELTPARLLDWLVDLDRRHPHDVVTVGRTRLGLVFLDTEHDADAIARELVTYCPQLLDHTGRSRDALGDQLRRTGDVLLDWTPELPETAIRDGDE